MDIQEYLFLYFVRDLAGSWADCNLTKVEPCHLVDDNTFTTNKVGYKVLL